MRTIEYPTIKEKNLHVVYSPARKEVIRLYLNGQLAYSKMGTARGALSRRKTALRFMINKVTMPESCLDDYKRELDILENCTIVAIDERKIMSARVRDGE